MQESCESRRSSSSRRDDVEPGSGDPTDVRLFQPRKKAALLYEMRLDISVKGTCLNPLAPASRSTATFIFGTDHRRGLRSRGDASAITGSADQCDALARRSTRCTVPPPGRDRTDDAQLVPVHRRASDRIVGRSSGAHDDQADRA